MANYVLGYSDIGINANYEGGVWRDDLDTRMLNKPLLTATAKTLDLAELVLDITLNESKDIQVLGICNHNLTTTGTYKWECFSDSGRTISVYDSGNITPYAYHKSLIHKTTCDSMLSSITNVYWRLTINDPSNTDGYIKIGRLFMGQRFDVSCNMSLGLKHVIDTSNTILEESSVGIEAFIQSVNLRGAVFSHLLMEHDQGDLYFKTQLEIGISESVLYEFNPDDKKNGIYTFIGRNETINPLDYPYALLNNLAFALKEII